MVIFSSSMVEIQVKKANLLAKLFLKAYHRTLVVDVAVGQQASLGGGSLWLRQICFPKMVQWCNNKLAPPSLAAISLKLVAIDRYQVGVCTF
jgi:hypothetical protein